MRSREAILAHIRAANAGLEPAPFAPYRAPDISEPVERFRARAEALSSTVVGPLAIGAVPSAVAAYLSSQALPPRAVAWPGVSSLDWSSAGIEVAPRPAQPDDLVGMTGVFCAIAETGTLMLLSGAQTPATTSLLPETHIALVPTNRVVAHMEDAWALLLREEGALPRAVNFVSGPSRTADIEQTVTLGAHGPYRVLIVLMETAA